jgi:hypothetical protein
MCRQLDGAVREKVGGDDRDDGRLFGSFMPIGDTAGSRAARGN